MESEDHNPAELSPGAELAAATRALRMEVQRRKRWGAKRTAALAEPMASAAPAPAAAAPAGTGQSPAPAPAPDVLVPRAPVEPAPVAQQREQRQPGSDQSSQEAAQHAQASVPARPAPAPQNAPKPPQAPREQQSSPAAPSPGSNLEILRDQIRTCAGCSLGASPERSGAIVGGGAARPKLLYITDHIGPTEAARGKALDQESGKLLMEITTAGMGLKVEEVHTTSAVKCGLPPGCVPSPKESAACRQWLAREIQLLRPAAIVTLGAGAAKALFENPPPGGGFQGKVLHYKGIPTVAIHHPRAMLNRKDLKGASWASLKLLIQTMRG